MTKRNISWEIIIAGLAFVGIGIYVMQHMESSDSHNRATALQSHPEAPTPPTPPSLPGAIVIDLTDLESLENLKELRKLKDLKNLEHLEFEIKNIDKLVQQHSQNELQKESLNIELQELEKELQKLEQSDFNVRLRDKKLYINKKYSIHENEWSEVNSGVFVYRDSFSVEEISALNFNVPFGNINIVGNESANGEITLRATGDIDSPKEIANQLSIQKNIINDNADFNISTTTGSSLSQRINLEATLEIPKDIALKVNTSGGHITASQLNNIEEIITAGGHITLTDIKGDATVKTSGGHITGNNITGDISIKTGGGHIKVEQTNGTIEAQTGGGHIEIQDVSGSISAKTSGGNISSTIRSANNQLRFSTSAGNVSLTLPSDIAANLEIQATSIDLDETFTFDGEKSRKNITGTLNGGGVPIVISCGYGNVTINTSN
ncbi:DUF4097 family beta strand repeat-containing protein [Fodinibius sp. N2]|uniref:DUF4097 family beta strand repeat-containing protein n=1 Tax=Fodinibius alkaliphilus TaxID=3140241 RepID=UPI00315A5955